MDHDRTPASFDNDQFEEHAATGGTNDEVAVRILCVLLEELGEANGMADVLLVNPVTQC